MSAANGANKQRDRRGARLGVRVAEQRRPKQAIALDRPGTSVVTDGSDWLKSHMESEGREAANRVHMRLRLNGGMRVVPGSFPERSRTTPSRGSSELGFHRPTGPWSRLAPTESGGEGAVTIAITLGRGPSFEPEVLA